MGFVWLFVLKFSYFLKDHQIIKCKSTHSDTTWCSNEQNIIPDSKSKSSLFKHFCAFFLSAFFSPVLKTIKTPIQVRANSLQDFIRDFHSIQQWFPCLTCYPALSFFPLVGIVAVINNYNVTGLFNITFDT